MKLAQLLAAFGRDEQGAVTVDWVVLTAAIVGMGMVVMTTLSTPINNTAGAIADDLNSAATDF
jgi:Flp pilus assembly pilin Flp